MGQSPSGNHTDSQFLRFGMRLNAFILRGSYLACGTSMLDETTLRFCSRRDTDRASGSRLTRFPSTGLCSSTASGLQQPLSNLWPSETPLLELCCQGVNRGISHFLHWNKNSLPQLQGRNVVNMRNARFNTIRK